MTTDLMLIVLRGLADGTTAAVEATLAGALGRLVVVSVVVALLFFIAFKLFPAPTRQGDPQ